MQTYFGSQKLNSTYPDGAIVAIGNFDGVHLGHQEILQRANALGLSLGVPVVVFTFRPHPTLELRPEIPLRLLMTYDEKRSQLERSGVQYCVEEPFNTEFAQTSAHDFFFEVLLRRLRARGLVVGSDFAFGRKREGKLDLLQTWCHQEGVALEVVPPLVLEGAVVSSSRIRELLQGGELDLAKALSGRAFFYRGEIVHGDKRGRLIGFPTANMDCEEKFPLSPGVYATTTVFSRQGTDIEWISVTNIGRRPTFQAATPNQRIPLKIETHILDQHLDLYGQTLEVRFHHRIRDEQRFDGIESLKAQIGADIELARKLLRARNF